MRVLGHAAENLEKLATKRRDNQSIKLPNISAIWISLHIHLNEAILLDYSETKDLLSDTYPADSSLKKWEKRQNKIKATHITKGC